MNEQKKSIFSNHEIMCRALKDSFIKLNPRTQIKNPVMFMVFVSAILTFVMFLFSLAGIRDAAPGYILAISVILWFTVLFGNFAEAIAEGRGKAQADALRAGRKDTMASRIPSADRKSEAVRVKSTELKKGDLVYIKAGEQIPADGDVVEGAASVDESAITGESAPVIRESGGDRSAVTGGTTVISDWIVVRVSSNPGEGFMDKMIAMVEGASRKKTPNELALQIFLVALSIIFVLVTMSLYAYSVFSSVEAGAANPTSITNLVALLICLAPTTIGALLSAIGIAGMSRLNQANVLAMSGRAIEGSISHDLRTPLTGITGSAGFLLDNLGIMDEATIKSMLKDICSDSEWLSTMVENLLNLTRIQEGRLDINKKKEVVDDLVASAVRLVSNRVGNHTLKMETPEDILLVSVDGRLFIQVLVNLLDNAFRHSGTGTTVTLRVKQDGNCLKFVVSDNGIGIPNDKIDKIFDNFFTTAYENGDKQRGVGLGLTICKAMVEAQGGTIRAFNSPQGGAVFEVSMPMEDRKDE